MVANGATVILACRNRSRADAARAKMLAELANSFTPPSISKVEAKPTMSGATSENENLPKLSASEVSAPGKSTPGEQKELLLEERVLVCELDLARLSSVRACVKTLEQDGLVERIDLLILNAGIPG